MCIPKLFTTTSLRKKSWIEAQRALSSPAAPTLYEEDHFSNPVVADGDSSASNLLRNTTDYYQLGGKVASAQGIRTGQNRIRKDPLFHGLGEELDVWMSHGDRIEEPPQGFLPLQARQFADAAFRNEPGLWPAVSS
jgi:hypothetical protein